MWADCCLESCCLSAVAVCLSEYSAFRQTILSILTLARDGNTSKPATHLTGLGATQADDAQNVAQAPRPRVEAPVCVPVTPQARLGNPLPPITNSGMYPARCGRANYFAGMPGSITQAHSSPTHSSGRNDAGVDDLLRQARNPNI